jgi:hypothetical protein
VLGFEKLRLKVRNLTDVITESGTNASVPQVVGAGKLVAVARYHRNPCYKPDLTGERVVNYYEIPAQAVITEPSCTSGLRTNYQEISVSAPLTIASETDIPGGRGGTPPASVEKIFDFSADPIPVNATDLFIQVVYRGQLGAETDGIAVGMIDTQEPTLLAAWNNTDYYFSEVNNSWLPQNPLSFPSRGIDGVVVCAGVPSAMVYRYYPENGLPLPFYLTTMTPGIVRLALVLAKPVNVGGNFNYRVNPFSSVPPSAAQRLFFSRGLERQASQEIFTAAVPLPAPRYCQLFPPAVGSTYWCFDPVKSRRGQIMGDAIQPMYYNSGPNASPGPDVDAFPAQVVFPGMRTRPGGVVRFDDPVLTLCPAPTF